MNGGFDGLFDIHVPINVHFKHVIHMCMGYKLMLYKGLCLRCCSGMR